MLKILLEQLKEIFIKLESKGHREPLNQKAARHERA
jgi:hypothetical protein